MLNVPTGLKPWTTLPKADDFVAQGFIPAKPGNYDARIA